MSGANKDVAARDVVVVGGGLVGAAVAYGLARQGLSVVMLDEGDVAYRASRGNFGLVWVQSKGDGFQDYARWTRGSADLWPGFAEELKEAVGIAVGYRKPGGVHLCLSEQELEEVELRIRRMHNQAGEALDPGGDPGSRLLDRAELEALLPGVGPEVVGGAYSPHDGHVSPLYLLRALHEGFLKLGGLYRAESRARRIASDGAGFLVETEHGRFRGARVVLGAGLGNKALGKGVGLDVPVSPLKGQILVTERAERFLELPTINVRQTEEGTVMLGDSHEDVGYDTFSKPAVMSEIARRALVAFPALRSVKVVRAWGALRVMTPDGFPIYEESESHPGAFAVNCHSGVTLAAAHALKLAPLIGDGGFSRTLASFSSRRFDAEASRA
ncbi:Glycine/D-amino acid oxidase [Tistlia consotensis]|uniref:Glycine/D-amino acid oxidase n=1 Tax=Tistlia consotensis USBA 355 TaxID=560819 RepID=A0A1Y6CM57_9PROT|nr:FAD-dependent oxidoreductase [Tistlia consotensis]SMF77070.1 Glycine/D-amino acid oxidase [Tistlia consotensis USBA 355]SNS14059.1 Glycine/D-amino acid oxidase [Tistlia consotensis]